MNADEKETFYYDYKKMLNAYFTEKVEAMKPEDAQKIATEVIQLTCDDVIKHSEFVKWLKENWV